MSGYPYDDDIITQIGSFVEIVLDFRCNIPGVELVLKTFNRAQ